MYILRLRFVPGVRTPEHLVGPILEANRGAFQGTGVHCEITDNQLIFVVESSHSPGLHGFLAEHRAPYGCELHQVELTMTEARIPLNEGYLNRDVTMRTEGRPGHSAADCVLTADPEQEIVKLSLGGDRPLYREEIESFIKTELRVEWAVKRTRALRHLIQAFRTPNTDFQDRYINELHSLIGVFSW